MNFLTICKEVNDRMGFQGELVSTEDASGYQRLVVDMTSDAWRDVQSYRSDWAFLKKGKAFTLTAGETIYHAYNSDTDANGNNILTSAEFARFGHWDMFGFDYPTDGTNFDKGTTPVTPVHYNFVRRNGYSTSSEKPTYVASFDVDSATNSAKSDQSLFFLPVSTSITLTTQYYQSPQLLANDDDEPDCPQEHHQIVVWAGLKNVANFMGNAAVYQYAIMQYDKALGALMRREIPSKTVAMRSLV